MTSYYQDASEQFDKIISKKNSILLNNKYTIPIKKIFLKIYAINYIQNRVEVRKRFTSDYCKVGFSCLLEAFLLILDNYIRGSELVLRSSLENYLKFIIYSLDNEKEINDRSYTINKTRLTIIINSKFSGYFRRRADSINGSMEANYKKLSAISHSLVTESKQNMITYVNQIDIINEQSTNSVINRFDDILKYVLEYYVIICKDSMRKWITDDLNKLLRLSFSKGKVDNLIFELKR